MKKGIATVVICYKRPYHVSQVLKRLEEENIQNLYIFSDGARGENDREAVASVREVVRGIRWTRPHFYFMETNLGCSKMIPNAVTCALEENNCVIVLESDCVPKKYYFKYIRKCLEIYAEDPQIMSIAGYSVPIPEEILRNYPYDVYFYNVMGCDGWATWRRAWKFFDPDLPRLHQKIVEKGIDIFQGGGAIANSTAHKLMDPNWQIWSVNWVLSMYLQKAYCVYPVFSQIDNIGWDGSGEHCTKEASKTYPNLDRDILLKRYPDGLILHNEILTFKRKLFACWDNEPYDYNNFMKRQKESYDKQGDTN